MQSQNFRHADAWMAAKSFFLSTLLGTILLSVCVLAGDVLQTDFLNDNPHRSRGHALSMVFVLGPVFGIVRLYLFCSFALFAAMTFAGLLAARMNRVPLSFLLAATPVFWTLIYVQVFLLPEYNFYTDVPEEVAGVTSTEIATRSTAWFVALLAFAWWRFSMPFRRTKS
ncbi:hypothetical protein [Roseibium sp.]|uniref:hypothetical protein n=1 Tax=Roseibium sp. TaxID=1936156 RepID=UPI003B5151DB